MQFSLKNWDPEAITGYKPITTFYLDFSIADQFGTDGINDTYKRAFEEWKSNCKYMTELVMVLNWKIYEHYGTDNEKAELYDKLWREADAWACENLKGDDLNYFYKERRKKAHRLQPWDELRSYLS